MARARVFTLAALLVAVLVVAPAPSPGAIPFTQHLVSDGELTGEPGIAIDPTNASKIYVTAPGVDGIWISTNGGDSFTLKPFPKDVATPSNDGDADVAVDGTGRVYVSGLLARGSLDSTIPVAVLNTNGQWSDAKELMPNAVGIECDRQWTAARGTGIVVHAANCGSVERAWLSTDGGKTFSTSPITVASGVDAAGPLLFGANGTLYQPYATDDEIHVVKGTVNTTTKTIAWSRPKVSGYSGRILFWPAMDADSTGNLYVAWSQSPVTGGLFFPVPPSGGAVYLSRSTNGGTTWQKQTVSAPGRTAIFPWVTAGGTGKVDVSFYAANSATSPDLGTPATMWDVQVAQTLNGTAPTPSFTLDTVIAGFHTGSICTEGLLCIGPQNFGVLNAPTPFDRRVLDFFETAADPAGNLYIVYPKDRPTLSTSALFNALQPRVDLFLAKQTGDGNKIRP